MILLLPVIPAKAGIQRLQAPTLLANTRQRTCSAASTSHAQSPIPRGSTNPDDPATTLRKLMTAAADNERRANAAGTLPPKSVSDA